MNSKTLKAELRKHIKRFNCREFTVIQVGTGDGITDDPVHEFWKRNTWNGLFVEPVWHLREKAEIARGGHGVFVSDVVRDFNGPTDFFYLKEDTKGPWWRHGFASARKDVYFKHEWAFKNGLIDKTVKETVTAITLPELLRQNAFDRCDWLVVDVEGSECEVFAYFDQMPDKPRMVLYEHKHLTVRECAKLQNFFLKREYSVRVFPEDTLAVL